MNTLARVLVAVLIFFVALWLIALVPIPVGLAMIRWLLYVVAGVVLIAYLLRYT